MAVVALLAAGCTTAGEVASGTEDDPSQDEASRHALQDVWMFTRMQAVDDDGTTVDVIADVVEELESRAASPVDIVDELVFRAVPDLAASFVSPLGDVRQDVDVVVGLFEVTDHARALHGIEDDDPGRTIGILASAPADGHHVTPGDLLQWDIFGLGALTGIDVVLVDHTFAHSHRGGSEENSIDDPIDLLAQRWQQGEVSFGGPEDGAEGEVAVLTSVPLERGSAPTGSAATRTSSAQGAVAQIGPAVSDSPVGALAAPATLGDSAVIHPANDGPGGPGGSMVGKVSKELLATAVTTLICAAWGKLAGIPGVVVTTVICAAIGAAGAIYTLDALIRGNFGPPPPPPPPPGPLVRAFGDPYLTTVKNNTFILHAAGEFTAVRTEDEQVDIQARMEPIDDWVSLNSAVAARVEEHRVTIDADREHLVHLDGEPLPLEEFDERSLDGGGTVTRHGTEIIVQWPESETRLSARLRGGIDYQVHLGEEHLEQMTGLHGDHEGERWYADGQPLPVRPSHDELHAYADSWRITDATSLFDYADGASTATYTDRDFPSTAPSLDLLEDDRRAWATTICQGAGLTGFFLDACIVDLALTGDTRFVQSAVGAQAEVAPEEFDHSAAHALYAGSHSTAASEVVWATDVGADLVVEDGEDLVAGAGIVVTQQCAEANDDFNVTLQARDLTDGSLRWEAEGFHRCRPVITGDVVVAVKADDDGTLVALDPRTGEERGDAALAGWNGGCVLGLSTTSTGLVLAPRSVVGSRTPMSQLRAFEAGTMEQVWSRDFDGDVLGYAAADQDRAYVLDRGDGESVVVHRLDLADGSTAASVELPITSTASTREGALVALPDGGAAVLGQRANGDDVLVVLRDRGAELEVA